MRIEDGMRLEDILLARPLAVGVLEQAAGHRIWLNLSRPFGDFCASEGLDGAALRASLAALPAPEERADWDARPVYVLIDHLASGHARFRRTLSAVLRELRRTDGEPSFPDRYVFRSLELVFLAFEREFLDHLAEEERFLFPKVIRNEACFRHVELYPEVYRGSVNLYLTQNRHDPGKELKRTLVEMREKARLERLGEAARARLDGVMGTLDALDGEVERHLALEREFLFPRAGRLEQELYEGLVPGLSRYPGDA